MTNATCHGEKKLQKHQCILKIEQRHHNTHYVLTYNGHTESQYKHSDKQKVQISSTSSTTSNELVTDNEDSYNINLNITDQSSFQNDENISTICHGNKYREVNLHPQFFYYLSYQHNRMNGNSTPIFNSKKIDWNFFGKIIF